MHLPRKFDQTAVFVSYLLGVAILSILGIVILYSVGMGKQGAGQSLYVRQCIWLGLSIIGMLAMMRLNLLAIRPWIPVACVFTLGILVAVLIPGIGMKINGARRWIDLGPMNMQVSDFAKVGFVICLASYLSVNNRQIHTFVRGFLVPISFIGIVCLLILAQPDYGTTALVGTTGVLMLFVAGSRLLYLVPTLLFSTAVFSVSVFHDPVRWKRITSFLDVEANKSDGAYQLYQSMLSFNAGGLEGTGLGQGRQQWSFLPEAHTDFIFPIIGEELGFIYTAAVVVCFSMLFLLCIYQLRKITQLYPILLILGSTMIISLQAMINLGVVTGLLPTKGLPLPFISYGGSNLVCMFLLTGMILNGFRQAHTPPVAQAIEICPSTT